jgi:anthranilate synthase/aminodeoxychorismate synthase-like glutamine amidotransferase
MLLLIDNYDSFTYNLYQYLCELGAEVVVRRNDQIGLGEIEDLQPRRIVISPGPGDPDDAGISVEVIRRFGARLPLPGVCLGHQCIGAAFGGKVVHADTLMHGKSSLVYHDGKSILRDLPSPFEAIRYHSLAVDRKSLPDCLEVTAQTSDGVIMGLRHRAHPIHGVQFHPESIRTVVGKDLLRNFLQEGLREGVPG